MSDEKDGKPNKFQLFYDTYGVEVGQEVSIKNDEWNFKKEDKAKISDIVSFNLVYVSFENGGGGVWHIENLNIIGDDK